MMHQLRIAPFRLTSLVMGVLLLLSSTGCMTWQAEAHPLPPHLREQPAAVRVTLWDGRVLEINEPILRDDTIFGRAARDRQSAEEMAVPLTQVARMDVWKVDRWRPAKVLGVGALLAVIGYFIVAMLNY